MRKIKLQLVYFLIAFINIFSKWCVFFFVRRCWHRVFKIKYDKTTAIHANVKFFHVSNFRAGKNCTINNGCYIDNRKKVTIGNNVNISHDTKIYTLGHNVDSPNFEAVGAPVSIQDDVVIFSNVIILPGVCIKRGAVIYPGSIVCKDVEEYQIVGGNPAKFIRFRNGDVKYKINYKYWLAL